jgi:hypothetical protein
MTIIDGGTFDAVPDATPDAVLNTKELKATRARANGRLGGRPRKTVPEPVAPVAPPTTSSEVDALIATELVKPGHSA